MATYRMIGHDADGSQVWERERDGRRTFAPDFYAVGRQRRWWTPEEFRRLFGPITPPRPQWFVR